MSESAANTEPLFDLDDVLDKLYAARVCAAEARRMSGREQAAATSYPTDVVMCSSCAGTGEYDWNEIDIYSKCATCAGRGEIEVCAQCHDSGDECGACGV